MLGLGGGTLVGGLLEEGLQVVALALGLLGVLGEFGFELGAAFVELGGLLLGGLAGGVFGILAGLPFGGLAGAVGGFLGGASVGGLGGGGGGLLLAAELLFKRAAAGFGILDHLLRFLAGDAFGIGTGLEFGLAGGAGIGFLGGAGGGLGGSGGGGLLLAAELLFEGGALRFRVAYLRLGGLAGGAFRLAAGL